MAQMPRQERVTLRGFHGGEIAQPGIMSFAFGGDLAMRVTVIVAAALLLLGQAIVPLASPDGSGPHASRLLDAASAGSHGSALPSAVTIAAQRRIDVAVVSRMTGLPCTAMATAVTGHGRVGCWTVVRQDPCTLSSNASLFSLHCMLTI